MTKDIVEATQFKADNEGMTGFSWSCARNLLIRCWKHEAELTNKEIDNLINQENGVGENLVVMQNGAGVLPLKPNEGRKGCSVEFNGPLNGLLNQVLLPDMTYVHHTLEGKFVDQDGKDLTKFMPISEYCMLRDEKNKQPESCFFVRIILRFPLSWLRGGRRWINFRR